MMRTIIAILALLGLAGMAGAEVVSAKGAKLRLLDKMSGVVSDFDLAKGGAETYGKLTVTLDDCRYPSDLPSGEAFAHLTIEDSEWGQAVFRGWMVASSPALSALDHPRYDVWVLRCDAPAATRAAPADTATDQSSGG
jgi:hypothetical protein